MGIFGGQKDRRLREAKVRLYGLIEHATSNLSAPNFALQTDVISVINRSSDPSYLSKKACRKFRKCLKGRSPLQQSLALQLVEACVRSCGEPFQGELARSELLGDLAGMGENSSWCPPETRQQVLTLLQEWALTLPSSQFSNAYDNLRARGVVFPARAPPGADGRPNPYPGLTQGMVPGALPPDSALPGSPAPQPGGRPSGGGRLAGGSPPP
ncbi:hypothetical protein H632_c1161p0, partial [Helicosporidium sp. ATCC 50920]